MKLTSKTLKTISLILGGLSLFTLAFTVAYTWKNYVPGDSFYILATIGLALLAGIAANSAKRKIDQEL